MKERDDERLEEKGVEREIYLRARVSERAMVRVTKRGR